MEDKERRHGGDAMCQYTKLCFVNCCVVVDAFSHNSHMHSLISIVSHIFFYLVSTYIFSHHSLTFNVVIIFFPKNLVHTVVVSIT